VTINFSGLFPTRFFSKFFSNVTSKISFFVLLFVVASLNFSLSNQAQAEVNTGTRHMFLLRAGMGQIIGTYYFAVNVTGEKPETLKFRLLLPKEVVDFAPAEGLETKDIALGQDGGIYVDKEFNPGFNLIGVYFNAKSPDSYGQLTLDFPADVVELRVISQSEGLEITSPGFEKVSLNGNEEVNFKSGIASKDVIKSGTKVVLSYTGLPEDRSWFWILGSITAGLIIGLSLLLSFKTKESALGAEVKI
jgi:hypothetical protein